MRLTVRQTECAGKMFWIVKDAMHDWEYFGPFADQAAAHAFARPKNSDAWKALLRDARAAKKVREADLEEAVAA